MVLVLLATGTLEKVAWVVGVLVVVVLVGSGLSRTGGARFGRDLEDVARRDADRSFRRPPDEGGLL